MKLALVGVGNAGCRIVNRIVEYERETKRTFSSGNVLLINTVQTEFERPLRIKKDRQFLLGETHDAVDDRGVDGDVDLAAAVAREDIHDIRREFDAIDMFEPDGVLLVAGLGGGTGAGAGAVVLEELKSLFEKPVYALGVLPGDDEGPRRALNASRALRSFVPTADNVILFDNHVWLDDDPEDDTEYEQPNRELAVRVTSLLGAGEIKSAPSGENAIDTSDMIRTLDTGGVSSIGYASIDLRGRRGGLLSWIRGIITGNGAEEPSDAVKLNTLVRRAANSTLTLQCDVSSAERALVVLSGPPSTLSRRGFEGARHWLEEKADTVEVIAGDEPRPKSSTISAVVLLSNVTEVPRIGKLQERGLAYQETAPVRSTQGDPPGWDFGRTP